MPKNFRPRVIEPANSKAPNGVGVAVEVEFHEKIPGLGGDAVLLYLADDATFEDGEKLCRILGDMVAKISVSNATSI